MGIFFNKAINLEANVAFTFKPFKISLVPQEIKCQCKDVNEICCRNVLPDNPFNRNRIVCDSVNMYYFGDREVWRYSITTSLWTKLIADEDILPLEVVKLSDQLILVYGIKFENIFSKNVYICEIQNNSNHLKFRLIYSTEFHPRPHDGSVIVLENQYLYTIGCINTEFEDNWDIYRQNIINGDREPIYISSGLPNEPPRDYNHKVAFEGNKIYILGVAEWSNTAYGFQVIFAFNLSTNEWEQISVRPDDKTREGYPEPRRCHSWVQYGSYAYLSGGFNGSKVLKDIWRLDLRTLEWMMVKELFLPVGICWHSSCITSNGRLITFGGAIERTRTQPSDTFSLVCTSTVYTTWLCIPKLKDICWEALKFYHPNLCTLTEKELLSVGVPCEFISKLDLQDKIKRLTRFRR